MILDHFAYTKDYALIFGPLLLLLILSAASVGVGGCLAPHMVVHVYSPLNGAKSTPS